MSILCTFCNMKIDCGHKCRFCSYSLDIIFQTKSYTVWKCLNCKFLNTNTNTKCSFCNIDKDTKKQFIIKKWFCSKCDTENIYDEHITNCSKCNFNDKLNIFRHTIRENILETKVKSKFKKYEDEIKKLDTDLHIYSLKKEMWEMNDNKSEISYDYINNIWEYKKNNTNLIYTSNSSILSELDYEFEKQAKHDIDQFHKLYIKKIYIFDIDKWSPEEVDYYNTIFHDNLLIVIRTIDSNLVSSFIQHDILLTEQLFSNTPIDLNLSKHNIQSLRKSLNDAYLQYKLYLKSLQ